MLEPHDLDSGAREADKEISVASSNFSRRKLLQAIGASALTAPFAAGAVLEAAEANFGIASIPGVPRIAIEIPGGVQFPSGTIDEHAIRRVTQLGVNDVLTGGPRLPWQENDLRA